MILSISGYAGCGKDTAGKYIVELEPSFTIRKFAGKLKQIASLLTGIPVERFEDQEFKKSYLPEEWSYMTHPVIWDDDGIGYSFGDVIQPMTVRDLLQKLGTEAMREGLHQNTWLNALYCDYKPILDPYPNPKVYPDWVITDARFINELKSVKEHGGITIKINRPNFKPLNNHPSETEQDNWNYDYIIENNGSPEDLKQKIRDLLHKIIKWEMKLG